MNQSFIMNHIRVVQLGKWDYFIAFLFIVLCGFPAADLIPGKTYFLILIGCVYLFYHKKMFQSSYKPLFILTISFICIFIHHYVCYNYSDPYLTNTLRLGIAAYMAMIMLGARFRYAFLNLMTFFAAVSIFFFLLTVTTGFIPDIPSLRPSGYQGIFIYNMRWNEVIRMRNCGPFFEPGAYSGYLVLTFALFFTDLKELWNNHRKKCVIMGIALLTTSSTQGYFMAFFFLVCVLLRSAKPRNIFLILSGFCLLMVLSFYLYRNLPFLQEKVNEQLMLASSWDDPESLLSANRFTTTMIDIDNIYRNPLWGLSSDVIRLYGDYPTIMMMTEQGTINYASGSGMTSFIAQNGILLFIVWLILSYKSLAIYYSDKRAAVLITFLLCLLGQGEVYIGYIFYMGVPFLRFCKYQRIHCT